MKEIILEILLYLSNAAIPLTIVLIVGYGILEKQNVYQDFIHGAKNGFETVIQIMPTLVGLMVAIGLLRASGFLEMLAKTLGIFTEKIGFPASLVPLAVIRLFSSSAAAGILLDIFKEYGTDSVTGLTASVMASSCETVFYTMSVYFIAAHVKKTRWTLPGALIATAAGILASVLVVKWFMI